MNTTLTSLRNILWDTDTKVGHELGNPHAGFITPQDRQKAEQTLHHCYGCSDILSTESIAQEVADNLGLPQVMRGAVSGVRVKDTPPQEIYDFVPGETSGYDLSYTLLSDDVVVNLTFRVLKVWVLPNEETAQALPRVRAYRSWSITTTSYCVCTYDESGNMTESDPATLQYSVTVCPDENGMPFHHRHRNLAVELTSKIAELLPGDPVVADVTTTTEPTNEAVGGLKTPADVIQDAKRYYGVDAIVSKPKLLMAKKGQPQVSFTVKIPHEDGSGVIFFVIGVRTNDKPARRSSIPKWSAHYTAPEKSKPMTIDVALETPVENNLTMWKWGTYDSNNLLVSWSDWENTRANVSYQGGRPMFQEINI